MDRETTKKFENYLLDFGVSARIQSERCKSSDLRWSYYMGMCHAAVEIYCQLVNYEHDIEEK